MSLANHPTSQDAEFWAAFALLLRHEGGLSDHPNDPGGLTKYGISQLAFPKLDIRNLTEDQAAAIYYRNYWVPLRCGDLRAAVGTKLFDMGVNLGKQTAVRILQESINALTRAPVAVDGLMGMETIRAANNLPELKLLDTIRMKHGAHYKHLIKKNPTLAVFAEGWERRANA